MKPGNNILFFLLFVIVIGWMTDSATHDGEHTAYQGESYDIATAMGDVDDNSDALTTTIAVPGIKANHRHRTALKNSSLIQFAQIVEARAPPHVL